MRLAIYWLCYMTYAVSIETIFSYNAITCSYYKNYILGGVELKGLILCAGMGSRLRPLTYSRPKHLLPLINKPVLFYGIESMIEAGITEIGIVVSPSFKKVFAEALQRVIPSHIRIELIEQNEPKGLAHAVSVARSFTQSEEFILYLGDNIIDGPLKPLIDQFYSDNLDGLVSVSPVEHPERFGVVEMSGNKISKVVEKPKNPPSNLAINGVYLFREAIYEAIAKIVPSARGEYEITDAIQQLIYDQYQLGIFHSPYWWKDTGLPQDLIICNQYYLSKIKGINNKGMIDSNSSVSISAIIGENTKIVNSVIRGPVIIGPNTTIENCYIGPFTSIAENVTMNSCELENSIVMENTLLNQIPHRIDESLIGGDVKMMGSSQIPNRIHMWMGDHTLINFPK